MRTSSVALAILLCASAWAVPGANPGDPALAAAEAWLRLQDAGNFATSWDQASRYFKENTPRDQWKSSNPAIQLFLGKVISRKVKSVEHMDRLPMPGLPPGKHAVIKFDTLRQGRDPMVETLTLMFEADGVWRVTGNN